MTISIEQLIAHIEQKKHEQQKQHKQQQVEIEQQIFNDLPEQQEKEVKSIIEIDM